MRSKMILMCALLVVAGCVPSLHSIVTEKTQIYDPDLNGKYRVEDADWTITGDPNDKSYSIVIEESEDKQSVLTARLAEFDGHRFLDFYPPEAKIIPIRCRPDSEGNEKDEDGRYVYEKYLIDGIRYAADHGAAAVTSSMGPLRQCKELQDAIDYAEQKGTIFIDVHPEYRRLLEKFTENHLDKRIIHTGVVSVPGHRTRPETKRDIYTWPYNIDPVYKDGWGFSNGPPIAAGVIALMKSANSELTCQQIRQIINETAYNRDGFNVLDAEAAVKKALLISKEKINE